MLLSVIIVNYNVKYFLEQCLYSVCSAINCLPREVDAEIIVFDNASTDNSRDFFEGKFPQVNFIWHTENIGFAKANNKALLRAKGKYNLFLNPDTIVSEDSFVQSISFLETHTNIGALGIRMIDGCGDFLPESKRGFPSPAASFYKLSGLIHLFPHSKKIARYYAGHLSEYESNEVDVLSGAYMMVKKKVLDETGGFDEQFFMYGEDIDLSYRIQKAGYKNYYFAESTIIHFKGESTNQHSAHYVKVFYKAMNIFVRKHFHTASSWWYVLFVQMAIFAGGILSFIKRFFSSFFKKKSPHTIETLLIATPQTADEVLQILSNYKTPVRKITQEMAGISSSHNHVLFNEIIVVAGEISYKTVIGILEKNSMLEISFKLHAPGSQSIIGSNSKTSNGEVLSKN